ncbi:MAG: hypothetical protein LUF90_00550 [Rikenellaceae bacterium]|nr:hypothetical protein [Rikenellaceae bacterium]
MRKNQRVDFTRIRTLSELHAERRRVSEDIVATGTRINVNTETVGSMFRVSSFWSKIDSAIAFGHQAYSAFSVFNDRIRRRKNKKRSKKRKKDCEID